MSEHESEWARKSLADHLEDLGVPGAEVHLDVLTRATNRSITQLAEEEGRIGDEDRWTPADLNDGPVEKVCRDYGVSAMAICAVAVALEGKMATKEFNGYTGFCTGFLTALNMIAIQSEDSA